MKNLFKTPTAASAVTLASFVASAAHIVKVVDATNHIAVALVYPIGIDGLLYIGIRAMQTGRKGVGTIALLVGAVYSLAFNAHAEGAITMDPLLIAASMPVCFLAGVLIETTAKDETVQPVREVEKEVRVYPELLPIAPPARAEIDAATRELLDEIKAQSRNARDRIVRPAPVQYVLTRPAKVETPTPIVATITAPAPKAPEVEKPKARRAISTGVESSAPGRKISWDVAEAIRLMDEGKTNEEVGLEVGTAPRQMARVRRILGFVRNSEMTDAEIRETISNQLSLPVIAAIRKAA